MWYGLFWKLGIHKRRGGSVDFVSYNLKLFVCTPCTYMGPQRRGTTYAIWRKYFDFVCSYPLWDPLVTLQMSPTIASSSHIRRSISRPSLFAAFWCAAAVFARLLASAERSPHPSRIWRCQIWRHAIGPTRPIHFPGNICRDRDGAVCRDVAVHHIVEKPWYCISDATVVASDNFKKRTETVNVVSRSVCMW